MPSDTDEWFAPDPPDIPEHKASVVLVCNGMYWDVDAVQFEDISEDPTGRDLMTFTCPECGQIHKSYILG